MSAPEGFADRALRRVRFQFGDRHDGDFGAPSTGSGRTPVHVSGHPSTILHQVHGARVVVVERPGAAYGFDGDALVTEVAGAVLGIRTADCVPIVIAASTAIADRPIVAAVHGGWRGLYEGVLEATVATMVERGAHRFAWRIGPCISPSAYEFSPAELTKVALRFGPEVVAAAASGAPALDLPAAVRVAAAAAGLEPDAAANPPVCTANALDHDGQPLFWSWRARRDKGRQLSSVWIEP